MMTVHEVSRISGARIRALHHYDAIGLLPATEITDAGQTETAAKETRSLHVRLFML